MAAKHEYTALTVKAIVATKDSTDIEAKETEQVEEPAMVLASIVVP